MPLKNKFEEEVLLTRAYAKFENDSRVVMVVITENNRSNGLFAMV